MRSFLVVLAAVNPAAVALALRPPERRVPMAVAAVLAAACAIALAGVSGPVLDALDVSLGTFRVAAGIVVGVAGLRWLVAPVNPVTAEVDTSWRRVVVPLLIPVLITPQLAMASLTTGADDGAALVVAAAAVSFALAWLAATTGGQLVFWAAGARFVGAFGVAVSLSLIVDGVQTI